MSSTATTVWNVADRAPVLISPNLNAGVAVYPTWAFVDYDGDIEGGFWLVLTNDESQAFTCIECGSLCQHPLDIYSQSSLDPTLRKLDSVEKSGLEFFTTDRETLCRECCETELSEWGGVTYLHDEEETRLHHRFETPPTELYNILGDVQLAVLRTVAVEADFACFEVGDPEYADVWADRVEITRRLASVREVKTANSFSASVSRAVHSLIDRGLLAGAYRGWREYYGDSPPMNTPSDNAEGLAGYQGPTPEDKNDNERPTLKKIRLRTPGKYVAALSVCDRSAD